MRIALGLLAATIATPLAIAVMWGALWYGQVEWFEGKQAEAVLESIRLYAMLSAPIALPSAIRQQWVGRVSSRDRKPVARPVA